MVTSELLDFIKFHIKKNTPSQHIEDLLMHIGGWKKEDIDEAFLVARFGYPVSEIPHDTFE